MINNIIKCLASNRLNFIDHKYIEQTNKNIQKKLYKEKLFFCKNIILHD